MRRLSFTDRQRQVRLARRRRQRVEAANAAAAMRRRLGLTYQEVRELGLTGQRHDYHVRVVAPQILSLMPEHYIETIKFLEAFREATSQSIARVLVSFSATLRVRPEFRIVLAAEFHRVRYCIGEHRITTIGSTSPTVRHLLRAIHDRSGIGLVNPLSLDPEELADALTMESGIALDGAVSARFSGDFSRSMGLDEADMTSINVAINEALENISEHAYPKDWELDLPTERGRWWLSWATYENDAYLLAYDLGVTVPRTVPTTARTRGRSNLEALARFLKGRREPKDQDLLEAAFDENVTRRADGRGGRGLARMAHIVKTVGEGHLLLMSGHASAYFAGDSVAVRTHRLPRRFAGTHVLWHLTRKSVDHAHGSSHQRS